MPSMPRNSVVMIIPAKRMACEMPLAEPLSAERGATLPALRNELQTVCIEPTHLTGIY
jgi:hypothetical protein